MIAKDILVQSLPLDEELPPVPPPKQGFYIYPDQAFKEWWVHHKKQPPLEDGMVIPILSAMQGHPESPRLWEKHANAILERVHQVIGQMLRTAELDMAYHVFGWFWPYTKPTFAFFYYYPLPFCQSPPA